MQEPIEILYKGNMLGTATVLLFIYPDNATHLYYHVQDSPKLALKGKWLSNFKPIEMSGEFLLPPDKTDISHLTTQLLAIIEQQYSELTYQNYSEEITHGRH